MIADFKVKIAPWLIVSSELNPKQMQMLTLYSYAYSPLGSRWQPDLNKGKPLTKNGIGVLGKGTGNVLDEAMG